MDGESFSYFTFCSRTRCSQFGISSLIKFLKFPSQQKFVFVFDETLGIAGFYHFLSFI